MKNIFLHTSLTASLLLLMACSNDNNENPNNNGEINISQAVEFKVDFADFNAEQELNVTRSNNQETKLEQKIVDLGNGVLAQVTLRRDTAKAENQATTRALADDTYTMLAYDHDTQTFKGAVTGKVTSGWLFTPTSKKLMLTAGNYDFVLFNSKVTQSGDNLTVTRANAATALIGRTTQEIKEGQGRNYVSFNMKHVGAKVKIKLTGYMPCTDVKATLASVNNTDVPGSSVYNAATDTWNMGNGEATSANTTYATGIDDGTSEGRYITTSNEEIPFMASTDVSNLKLTFTSGSIYKQNMASAELTFSPKTTLKLEKNGAYILNINLMYNVLYLMSNGSVGSFFETTYGGGTKIPVGIVISQSKRLAIALHDVNGGNRYIWDTTPNYNKQSNNRVFTLQTDHNPKEAFGDMDGYKYTWEGAGSVNGSTVKANEQAHYPAFYYAAHYNPGENLTGTLIGKKWYLPAVGEWVSVFTSLMFGDPSKLTNYYSNYPCYTGVLNNALTKVGGTKLTSYYWVSTEFYRPDSWVAYSNAAVIGFGYADTSFGSTSKYYDDRIRPFIKY